MLILDPVFSRPQNTNTQTFFAHTHAQRYAQGNKTVATYFTEIAQTLGNNRAACHTMGYVP